MMKDIFHQSRWDYIYSDKISGEERVQKRITLVFNGDELVGMQGDLKPNAVPVVKLQPETTVNVPKRDLDKTLLEKVTSLFGLLRGDTKTIQDPENLKPKPSEPAY